MSDVDTHVPDPEFTAFLARDIARAARHDARFTPSRGTVVARRVGIFVVSVSACGVLLAAGLVLGASTGYASARVELERHDARTTAAPSAPVLLTSIPIKRAIAVTCNALAHAEEPAEPQQGIPTIDPLPGARSAETFGTLLGVRELPGGKVLVNDGGSTAGPRRLTLLDSSGSRRLVLLDSSLANPTVTLDSSSGYGAMAPLTRFLGDSSLLPDPRSRTLRVIDGRGQTARVVPVFDKELNLFSAAFADTRGRVLFSSASWLTGRLDSLLVVRMDLTSLQIDTVGHVKLHNGGVNRLTVQTDARAGNNGYIYANIRPVVEARGNDTTASWPVSFRARARLPENLVPEHDGWAVTADGSIAFVRGQDYHIDVIHRDGSRSSTRSLPFDWPRAVDSSKAGAQDTLDKALRVQRDVMRNLSSLGDRLSGGVPAEVLADLDGNLWILPTAESDYAARQLTYDVVNANGKLFQRVRLPAGRSIAGFGKNGVLYLSEHTCRADGSRTPCTNDGFTLERNKLPK